ncbi:mitogen-activated protein kinase 15 [Anthonomus grandis grandis]|uniref:mitogen-activated protein kinase 15 n=1 Tax=Anthonomus grandis grandis TaxID=2921223 RepID=UPI0021669471|nr:mitogen-activated protein kinase 15 [Anthonomus grandis grandis]
MSQTKNKMSEIDDHISKRFDIQKRLGKGAYGIVWKAIDRKTKETVAIKKIFDAFRNQTDAQRTFREIMFLQSFKSHPNIVKLHSVHRAANNRDIYLGFEYMETDLHNVIKRGNILKEIHKKYIMYQLLKAVKYIHSGNVIHRDLKPSNVLLDSLCRCKLADFGLARSLTQGSTEGLLSESDPTLTDYVATRWYRAPEILIANRRYTKGIDMWSLGCILAEMLIGKPIFPGTSTVNQVEKIMATIPTPSSEDINQVCISGVGSSMIKNASSVSKYPLQNMLGSSVPADAVNLVTQLLLFNPYKRLKADEALNHEYVAKFHDLEQEIIMPSNVIIPLNDDVRLSVDDYRNKLYELMSSSNSNQKSHPSAAKPRLIMPDVYPKVTKNAERYIRSHVVSKERPQVMSQSESKISQKPSSSWIHKANVKSDSKVPLMKPAVLERTNILKASGDCKLMKSHSEVPKRRITPPKPNLYQSFNSFNKSHGIITQSALMELRATGFR